MRRRSLRASACAHSTAGLKTRNCILPKSRMENCSSASTQFRPIKPTARSNGTNVSGAPGMQAAKQHNASYNKGDSTMKTKLFALLALLALVSLVQIALAQDDKKAKLGK